jgi:homoserine kinase
MAGDATMSAPTAGTVNVRVPATTANLGPGFDCLGLALSLWNTATFTLAGDELTVMIAGEGAGSLPHDASNLVARAARRL